MPGRPFELAYHAWDGLLQGGHRVFGIGNSDAHHHEDIGAVFNFTKGNRSKEGVLNALRMGQVVFGIGPFLNFTITHAILPGGVRVPIKEEAILGGTVTVPYETEEVELEVDWINYRPLLNWLLDQVRVITIESDKGAVEMERLRRTVRGSRGDFLVSVPITKGTICIRLEGWDIDKDDEGKVVRSDVVVFTNPIWINRPPYRPDHTPDNIINIEPEDGATGVSLTPTLTLKLKDSEFPDPDRGDTHYATRWVVRRADNNEIAWDSGWRRFDLTSTRVPPGKLIHGTTYRWYVQYEDNHGGRSQPSEPTTFTTEIAVDPILGVTPPLDFEKVKVGESRDLSFTVTNVGVDTLTVEAISVPSPFYIISPALPLDLEEGKSTTVTVQFSPIRVGPVRQTVTFTSTGGNPTREVYGVGLDLAGPPTLYVSPLSLDFGRVEVGDSKMLDFTVTNIGGGTLEGKVTVETPFRVSPRFRLEAGKEAPTRVKFRPTAAGFVSATVTFTSNGGDLTRRVSGRGVIPSCFIATAAWGTPLAEEVEVLSRLRDEHLLTNELGQRLVAFYYRHSPALTEFISEREGVRRVVRIALWPLVRMAEFIVGEGEE